jgi:spoIIIJ-associated protein
MRVSDQTTTSETPSETAAHDESAPVEEAETAAPVDVDESTDDSTDDTTDVSGDVSGDDSGDDDSSSDGGDGDVDRLENEGDIAADYLEELLDIADLDGDIDTYIEGDRAHVSIVSESQVLVGPSGEVLDALQELTRLAVMTETGDRSRLMLDVAGYRDRRRQELVALATEAIAEVKSAGEKIALAPMNPFERKIVHDAVAAAGLTSESEGEEPKRHVVVLPV